MTSYLPSKKFILTFGIGLGVVFLGYVGWVMIKNVIPKFTPNKSSSKNTLLGDRAYARFSQDTDSDGLKDWEENLWNTDIKNADTDKDGTSDGEEVKQGRDPSKPGPDDVLNPDQQDVAQKKSKSLSEELARNIDIRYFTQKGLANNQPLSTNQKDAIVQGFINDIDKETNKYGDIFTESDINISASESMRSYGNKLGGALSQTFNNLTGYEIPIVDEAAKSGNFKLLNKLDAYIAGYTKSITFMKTQPVPQNMAKAHIAFMNALNNLKIADQKMKLLEEDSAEAVIGLRLFAKESPRLVEFLRTLRTELTRTNTVFAPSESGALFYKYFEIQLNNTF